MPRPPRDVPYVQFNVRVDPALLTRFEQACRERNLPAAEIVRRLMLDFIKTPGDFI